MLSPSIYLLYIFLVQLLFLLQTIPHVLHAYVVVNYRLPAFIKPVFSPKSYLRIIKLYILQLPARIYLVGFGFGFGLLYIVIEQLATYFQVHYNNENTRFLKAKMARLKTTAITLRNYSLILILCI